MKKIMIISGIIVGGIILYFISSLLFNGFSLLLPIFIITHVILSVYYSIKKYSKKILVILIILLLVHILISVMPFPKCDSFQKGYGKTCDCIGLKKFGVFTSQCIGIRTACYEYPQGYSKNINGIEIPCK